MKKQCLALAVAGLTGTCFARDSAGKFLSGTGYKLFLAYGAYHSFQTSKEEGTRVLDSLLTSGLLAEGLKRITNVERPDHSDKQSFPSGHATAAFTIATFEAETHPKEAIWWYIGAGLIGQSRVDLHRHHSTDVLAGAVLGCFVAKTELHSKGFILQPTPDGAVVLGYRMRF